MKIDKLDRRILAIISDNARVVMELSDGVYLVLLFTSTYSAWGSVELSRAPAIV